MDTLHSVLRSIRGETKSRPDHLTVFREFLAHLDRIGLPSPKRSSGFAQAGRRRSPRKPPSRRKANGKG